MRRLGVVSRPGWSRSAVSGAAFATLVACGGDRAADDSAAAASGASTAQASSGDADIADVSRYELTMDKIDQYLAATRNMAAVAKEMSHEERERLKSKAGTDASLDDYAANLEAEPRARDAIRRAGLSTREYATLTMAYLQAAMAQAVLQMRPDIKNADSIAREMKANPSNIRFVNENKATIEAKFKALEMEMKAAGLDQ